MQGQCARTLSGSFKGIWWVVGWTGGTSMRLLLDGAFGSTGGWPTNMCRVIAAPSTHRKHKQQNRVTDWSDKSHPRISRRSRREHSRYFGKVVGPTKLL